MKIKIEIDVTSDEFLEIANGKTKDIIHTVSNNQPMDLIKHKDYKGRDIELFKQTYKISGMEDSRRNTDMVKFEDSLIGKRCIVVRKGVNNNIVTAEFDGCVRLNVQSNWLEPI